MDWLPLVCTPTCNPGMCPHWESNQQPFALRDKAQPTEPHRSGQDTFLWLGNYGFPWRRVNFKSRLSFGELPQWLPPWTNITCPQVLVSHSPHPPLQSSEEIIRRMWPSVDLRTGLRQPEAPHPHCSLWNICSAQCSINGSCFQKHSLEDFQSRCRHR